MGLNHIAPQLEADNRRWAQHATWGHLFPETGRIFDGSIHIAQSAYGDLIVLKDNSNVPSSPWWFASLMDFTADFLMKQDAPGAVFKVQTRCSIVDDTDREQSIRIVDLGHRIILR